MFAKLFDTKHGQFLLRKIDDDDGSYSLVAEYNMPSFLKGSTCVVTKNLSFGNTCESEDERNRVFASFDQTRVDEETKL